MTQIHPDVSAVSRRSVRLEVVEPDPIMATAQMEVPGHGAPFRFMASPEALEYLINATDPAHVVQEVIGLVDWAANAMENAGKPLDAIVVRRLQRWLSGDASSPLDGVLTEDKTCGCIAHEGGAVCGKGGARECHGCGHTWCVACWHSSDHPCFAQRPRRELPPPIVPKPPDGPVVATLERVAATG